jgi:hypothetical protein
MTTVTAKPGFSSLTGKLAEIRNMLEEEFPTMNELTGTSIISSGIQTRHKARALYIAWRGKSSENFGSLACLQTVVQLCKGPMKVYTAKAHPGR